MKHLTRVHQDHNSPGYSISLPRPAHLNRDFHHEDQLLKSLQKKLKKLKASFSLICKRDMGRKLTREVFVHDWYHFSAPGAI